MDIPCLWFLPLVPEEDEDATKSADEQFENGDKLDGKDQISGWMCFPDVAWHCFETMFHTVLFHGTRILSFKHSYLHCTLSTFHFKFHSTCIHFISCEKNTSNDAGDYSQLS